MGKAGTHSLMEGARGMVGRKAVFRESYGETIIAARPNRRKRTTEGQLAFRAQFLQASAYAKEQLAKEDLKTAYKAMTNNKKRSAFTVAVADFLTPPTVGTIDFSAYKGAVGDQILITAYDDFKVVKVDVIIADATGKEIERGAATVATGHNFGWMYVATVANATPIGSMITAKAFDMPNHFGLKSVDVKLN